MSTLANTIGCCFHLGKHASAPYTELRLPNPSLLTNSSTCRGDAIRPILREPNIGPPARTLRQMVRTCDNTLQLSAHTLCSQRFLLVHELCSTWAIVSLKTLHGAVRIYYIFEQYSGVTNKKCLR